MPASGQNTPAATRQGNHDQNKLSGILRPVRGKESPQVGGDELDVLAARKMKVSWPFGAALRGEASSHRMLR